MEQKKSVYSVSQVNNYIKNMFSSDYALNFIYVKGEISNCKYHSSGHIYFTLKDRQSAMAGVMFASARRGLAFKLQEGMQVVVLGSISVYERDGRYQLYAKEILQDGIGLLYQRFEALKADLLKKGYFDEAHKKPIPSYAKTIGIVTADTGAALQDIINIATRRNPYVQLVLYPAAVQGDGAKETIVSGIKALETYGVDTIIVGRGGGSIEDLWAFNEESVALAIYQCQVPVISAVGHETDVTIADYVADLRAPTPSAAAELAVFDVQRMEHQIQENSIRLLAAMQAQLDRYKSRIERYALLMQNLSPMAKLNDERQYLMQIEERMYLRMQDLYKERKHQLALYIEQLKAVSPLEKLDRGFGFVTDEDGRKISSVKDTVKGQQIQITLKDGRIDAKVIGKEETYGQK